MIAPGAEKLTSPADLSRRCASLQGDRGGQRRCVRICIGTGCAAKGSRRLLELFQQAAAEYPADVQAVTCVGCHGFCERGPIVVVQPGGVFYQRVEEPDVAEIFRETVLGGRVVERMLYEDPDTGQKASRVEDIPFYRAQQRIVLAHNGELDPTSIDDYIATEGYSALAKALTDMTPEDVLEEVERSGLRGRGGGGFSTGRKWRFCRQASGEPKYVICNGDEGDPGAFMDRSLMEGNPHQVLEGLILGAYAIGATQGYLYVRNEYPLAVEHLRWAMDQARSYGLLGEKILGTDFSFDLQINRGAGAFVCGEETGLIASVQGDPGTPRQRPPYPAESGLWGKPTNINNVETWANVPAIVRRGGDWFAGIGTEGSKGTKVFSLVGQVVNTGLVEVPMGITLRRIIEEIGGGVKGGKAFKAVQTGGPSGGCIPAECLDTRVDFDELTRLGSMMGSGGMIVMDEDTCMVHVARYFLSFLREESCGKCTPCREGLAQMVTILDRITHGEGEDGDIERLQDLTGLLEASALCALGKTAAHPVLSTIRYFRAEYDEHIHNRHCPAKQCRGLFRYEVDPEACKACGICKKHCPVDAIAGEKKVAHVIDQATCTLCGTCWDKCPFDAIRKV